LQERLIYLCSHFIVLNEYETVTRRHVFGIASSTFVIFGNYYIRLMAFFYDNLGKLAPEK